MRQPRSRRTTDPVLFERSSPVGSVGSVVAVIAPAGAGKTHLLEQWYRQHAADVPCTLLDAPSAPVLEGAVDVDSGQGVVMIDHVDAMTDPGARRRLARLVDSISTDSPGPTVVVAGRSTSELRLPRLRALGALRLIDHCGLAMGPKDVEREMTVRELRADEQAVESIVAATAGWPAGVLRTLDEMLHDPDVGDALDIAADRLAAEQLLMLDPTTSMMLVATSVSDVVEAGVCHAVVDVDDPLERLRAARDLGVHLEPVDRTATRFELTPLLRRGLRRQLDGMRSSDEIRSMHRSVTRWATNSGLAASAVDQALRANELQTAADALAAAWADDPRAVTPEDVGRLAARMPTEYAPLMLTEALVGARLGDSEAVEALLHELERMSWTGPLPQGFADLASGVAAVRARLPDIDPEVASRDLRALLASENVGAPQERVQRFQAAYLAYLADDPELAHDLTRALVVGYRSVGRDAVVDRTATVLSLALQAVLAADAGDAAEASRLAGEAQRLRHDEYRLGELEDHLTVFLVTADALATADRSDRLDALGRARALHGAFHVLDLLSAIEIARIHDLDGDTNRALEVLAEAEQIATRVQMPVLLSSRLRRLRIAIDPAATESSIPIPITAGERAILKLLATSLTQQEIADRLGLSINTVKSHIRSIYLKTGVAARDELVAFAADLGLLCTVLSWHGRHPIDIGAIGSD